MKNLYTSVTLARHPIMGDDFFHSFDAGNLAPVHETTEGARLLELLTSVHGICAVVGAISAAPTKPPMPAVEGIIRDQLGVDVLRRHDIKQLTGRALRQIIEYLGRQMGRARHSDHGHFPIHEGLDLLVSRVPAAREEASGSRVTRRLRSIFMSSIGTLPKVAKLLTIGGNMHWTIDRLQALSLKQRETFFHNARQQSSPEASEIVRLLVENDLLVREGG